ncbi:DNA-binding transcriptional regulator [Fructobacillus tropaeoli]|uniref:MarR family (MarR) n=1 Tax=Fructobacillus tropaeoli TaxID=709323 RepID=A0ABM9MUH3_9LACO|nr:DNA-binding transcriptional regulator [Fructobacillus tropaeoli]CAK1245577.1 DNA-binding transcriptional regulator [Fructobacillus tropaeoli]
MDLQKFSQLLYQVKLVDQQITKNFENQVGFSLTRYALLMFLRKTCPCSQHQIKDALGIDNAAITRHLKVLEENGYVVRKRNEANNREVFVSLTEQAVAELDHCEQEYQAKESNNLNLLTDVEMNQLLNLLNKLDLQLSKGDKIV